MSARDVVVIVYFYVVVGVFTGGIVGVLSKDWPRVPDGGEVAAGLLAGVYWPLTLLAVIGLLTWRAARAIGRSFAVLWQARRPRSVPSAVARVRRGKSSGGAR